nr:thioredoxin family protein [Desulfuromonadales bacterium]NIS42294.1 thioredoxin family protein [Desulfuromonadales bacterium]
MKIEIVCRNEIYCDLMKARVEHALEDLHMAADVEYVMDHASQDALETDSKAGLVIDGRMIAIGTGHSIEDIRNLIKLQPSTR